MTVTVITRLGMMVRWEPGCEKAPAGNACTKTGEHTIAELAELFCVSRPKVYRVLERAARGPGGR